MLKKLLVAGSLLGAAAAFSPGGVFVLCLAAFTAWALHRFASPKDRIFLVRLFLIGFFIRAILSLGLDMGSWIVEKHPPMKLAPVEYWNLGIVDKTRDYLRMGDSDRYSERGYSLSQYAAGVREPTILRRIQDYGNQSYALIIGWFYTLFGFSPISVKLLNCWIGSLHLLPIFFLAKSCFQSTIARWAAVGVALCPTLVFWSATNLREPLLFLLTAILLLLFRALQETHRPGRWILTGGAFLLTFRILSGLGRQELLLALVACLAAAFFVEWCVKKRWVAALLLAAAAVVHFAPPVLEKGLRFAVYRHTGYVVGTGMVYRYLPEEFYPNTARTPTPVVLSRIPRAVSYYLLEPLPTRAGDWFVALLIPQMILWYFLLPLALIGAATGLRWNPWNCFFLEVSLFAWIVMGALSNANIGTLIRLRDMVTPIVLLFAAAGLWVLARGREGLCGEAPPR